MITEQLKNMMIPLAGLGVGYLATKAVTNKIGEKYPEKKELFQSVTAATFTGGAVYGTMRVDKKLKPFLFGVSLGAGAQTLVRVVSIPSVKDKIPAPIQTLLAGDDSELDTLRTNYAQLYDQYVDTSKKLELIANNDANRQLSEKISHLAGMELERLDYNPSTQMEGEDELSGEFALSGENTDFQEQLSGTEIEGEYSPNLYGEFDLI